MKIALISFYAPTYYNHDSPSALPYYIIRDMIGRAAGEVELTVWTFNYNCVSPALMAEVSRELGIRIVDMGIPPRLAASTSLRGKLRQVFARYPARCEYSSLSEKYRREIADYDADVVWLYIEEIAHLANDFPDKPVMITTPDCISMFYRRAMNDGGIVKRIGRWLRYLQYRRMEREFPGGETRRYHLVGENDKENLLSVNPTLRASFIRHPHYDASASAVRVPGLAKRRLSIVVPAGVTLYTRSAVKEMVRAFVKNRHLRLVYDLTLLGKGWRSGFGERLKKAGFNVECREYVDDFGNELARHDIAIVPVAIGSGTKGKSLDALVNGLLTIGTPVALENIAVADGHSALEYETADELARILDDVPKHPKKYEAMAVEGRGAVVKWHDSAETSACFYSVMRELVAAHGDAHVLTKGGER